MTGQLEVCAHCGQDALLITLIPCPVTGEPVHDDCPVVDDA